MAEYIDREVVKEIMQKYRCSDCTSEKSLDCPLCQLHRPFAEISKIPTADVVQVVKCKDCAVPHNRWTGCPKLNGLVTSPDFYCSYGERKKKENVDA